MVPSGMATASAISELISVPETSVMMPKRGFSNTGVHWVSVRKSMIETSAKNFTLSLTST